MIETNKHALYKTVKIHIRQRIAMEDNEYYQNTFYNLPQITMKIFGAEERQR